MLQVKKKVHAEFLPKSKALPIYIVVTQYCSTELIRSKFHAIRLPTENAQWLNLLLIFFVLTVPLE